LGGQGPGPCRMSSTPPWPARPDGVLYHRAGPEVGVAAQDVRRPDRGLAAGGLKLASCAALSARGDLCVLGQLQTCPAPRAHFGALRRRGCGWPARLHGARDFFFARSQCRVPGGLEGALKLKSCPTCARGLPRRRAQARSDRADRDRDGCRGGRHAQPTVREDAVEHRRGEEPGGDHRRRGQRRDERPAAVARPRALGAQVEPLLLPIIDACPSSSWPDDWPVSRLRRRSAPQLGQTVTVE